ncbi:hypothetical protein T439DRAFT_360799 [Meredithblackwellia eburnea MCA 4105]
MWDEFGRDAKAKVVALSASLRYYFFYPVAKVIFRVVGIPVSNTQGPSLSLGVASSSFRPSPQSKALLSPGVESYTQPPAFTAGIPFNPITVNCVTRKNYKLKINGRHTGSTFAPALVSPHHRLEQQSSAHSSNRPHNRQFKLNNVHTTCAPTSISTSPSIFFRLRPLPPS